MTFGCALDISKMVVLFPCYGLERERMECSTIVDWMDVEVRLFGFVLDRFGNLRYLSF